MLLGRLPLPMPPALRTALARSIARVGGQAIVEGVQEGGQQFLQNLIAREVYNPNQSFGEGVSGAAGVGGVVGGSAEAGMAAGRALLGRRGARGARAAGSQPGAQPEAPTLEGGGRQMDPAALAEILGAEPGAIDYIDLPGHISDRGDRVILNTREQRLGQPRRAAPHGRRGVR